MTAATIERPSAAGTETAPRWRPKRDAWPPVAASTSWLPGAARRRKAPTTNWLRRAPRLAAAEARAAGCGRSAQTLRGCILRGITFELSGRQRQDARPGLAKMYRVPPDRAWWPAVGAPLERGVRHPCALVASRVILHARDSASRAALRQEQSRYSASAAPAADLAWRSAPCNERHGVA